MGALDPVQQPVDAAQDVAQFVEVTALDEDSAKLCLAQAGGDLQLAIDEYLAAASHSEPEPEPEPDDAADAARRQRLDELERRRGTGAGACPGC